MSAVWFTQLGVLRYDRPRKLLKYKDKLREGGAVTAYGKGTWESVDGWR